MPVWPTTLPQYVLEQGYSENAPDQSIESQVDGGPVKQRRRYTTNFRPLKVTIRCEPDEVATFEDFYYDTLLGGTLTFDWVHPRTQAACVMRFRKPAPSIRPSGDAVDISMSLEIMP